MLSQTPKAVQVVDCNTRLRVSMLGIGQRKQNTSLDKLRSSWWTLPSSEKVRVNLRVFVNLHLLNVMLAIEVISFKKRILTILKVLSSSLICCASMGVNRLQVAISPRRSYSWLGQVSWKTMRGENVALRLADGVLGALLLSCRSLKADMK